MIFYAQPFAVLHWGLNSKKPLVIAIGEDISHRFTVGDQLLWGAEEPLRRMLGIVKEFVKR